MKVCKKCKGHVANKTRICKYCGADVSNAKIIKNVNSVNNQGVNRNNKKSKTSSVNVVAIKQSDHHLKLEKQNVVDRFTKNKNMGVAKLSSLRKRFVRKFFVNKNKSVSDYFEKIVSWLLIIKNKFIVLLNYLKVWFYKGVIKLGSFFKWLFYIFDRILDYISEMLAVVITKTCRCGNIFVAFLFRKLFLIIKTIFIVIRNGIIVTSRGFVRFLCISGGSIKRFVLWINVSLKKMIDIISLSFLERKRIQELKKQEEYNNKLIVTQHEKAYNELIAIQHEKACNKLIVEEYEKIDEHPNKDNRKSHVLKPVLIIIFILVFLGTGSYIGINVYSNLRGSTNAVIVSEKATREKIFAMNDVITYNGVDYKIVKVEKSNGNSYKSPKEGNQFLIVTVYIKNNTSEKVSYSYENWTMSNSKGEEKKRIFTSINVDNALYSGELVIGGIKTGSMVFEQPINDSKLILNFYDLKKDDNGNDVIDEARREFSVSIKVPSNGGKDSSNNDSNAKIIQTSDKIKN